jgi:alkylhydroperoxidase family enzyme
LRGARPETAEALRNADLDGADISEKEKALLEYVRTLTHHAYQATREDVEQLVGCGWSREAVAECVFVTALFALFNRVADAFGLANPNYDQQGSSQPPSKLAKRIDT